MDILKRFLLTVVLNLTLCLSVKDRGTIRPIALKLLIRFELHLFVIVFIQIILQLLHFLFVVLLLLALHEQHQLIISSQYVVIGYRELIEPPSLLIFMRLRVDLVGDEMVEDISDCMRPVQEELEEYKAKQVHGKASTELNVEESKVIVDEGQSRAYSH